MQFYFLTSRVKNGTMQLETNPRWEAFMETLTSFINMLEGTELGSYEYQLFIDQHIISKTYSDRSFSGTLVKQNIFESCRFENCTFFAVNFEDNLFINCDFVDCKFEFCKISNCNFENVIFERNATACSQIDNSNFTQSLLVDHTFTHARSTRDFYLDQNGITLTFEELAQSVA